MENGGFIAMFLAPGAAIFFLYLVEYYDNEDVRKYIKNQTWLFTGLLGAFIVVVSIIVRPETVILTLGMGCLFALFVKS